jgi:hypothetical protein
VSENVRLMGLPELRSRGFEALVGELGVANARFKRSRVFPFRKVKCIKS